MSRAWLQAGTVGAVLYSELTDPGNNDAAINLTGATLKLYINEPDGTELSTRTPSLNGSATLGHTSYTTQSDEFDTAGRWQLQYEVYVSAAVIDRSEVFAIDVKESLR